MSEALGRLGIIMAILCIAGYIGDLTKAIRELAP